jgi:hypothetical protein
VYWVVTVEHGGYFIDQVAQEKLTSAARAIGVSYEKWLCFEEDIDWAVVVYEHPGWATEPIRSEIVHALLQAEYPDYFSEVSR